MKKKFTSSLLWVLAIVASMSAFVSCKDYESDDMAEIRNEIGEEAANRKSAITTLQNNINVLEDSLNTKYNRLLGLIQAIDECDCDPALKADTADLNKLARRVATLADSLQDLSDKVDAIDADQIGVNRDSIRILMGLINNLNQSAYDATKTEQLINQIINNKGLKDFTSDINGLDARIKVLEADTARLVALENLVIGLPDDIKAAKSEAAKALALAESAYLLAQSDSVQAAKALALAQSDSVRIDDIETKLVTINDKITTIQGDITALQAKDDALNARIDSLAGATAAAIAELKAKDAAQDGRIDSLANVTNTLGVTVGDIQTTLGELAAKDADLQKQIDELKKIADNINNNYASTLKKLITGIIIQGTENDVTGYAALPLDVQSNILAAYYGVAANDVEFPDATGLYDASGILTAADVAGVKTYKASEGDTLINESPNNAGTLYLTVNPNTSDFSGVRPSLVNSQDEESAIKLGELQKSDKVLTFGVTRAEVNNAFYEVSATLDKAKINEAKIDFNKEAVTASIKNAVKEKSLGSLKNLATIVYGNFNEAFDRNGVKVEYTDDVLGDRGIYSDYSVLATAIKPLSYDFYAGRSLSKIRNFDLAAYVEKNFKFNIDSININLDGIDTKVSIPVALSVDVPINATATADSQYIYVKLSTGETKTPGGTDTIYAEGYVTVPATDGAIKDTIKVEKTFTTTADLADFLSSLLPDIQGQINKSIADMVSSINGKVTKIVSGLQKNYVNRINNLINKVNKVLADPNYYIQPTMLYEGADGGFHFLNHATFKLGGAGQGAALVATSRSAEIVAPAMKRFVKVVSAPAGADLNALNSKDYNMNKVVNGSEKIFIFAPTVAGQYEIVYSALDYAGKIRTVKYTVNVVE